MDTLNYPCYVYYRRMFCRKTIDANRYRLGKFINESSHVYHIVWRYNLYTNKVNFKREKGAGTITKKRTKILKVYQTMEDMLMDFPQVMVS